MDTLPSEVLATIFKYLDDKSLLVCENVCTTWLSAIILEKIYAKRCDKLRSADPTLISTFAHHKFDSLVRGQPEAAKDFYFKLKGLAARWHGKQDPTVYSYFCQSGDVSQEWMSRHNYTGVYDCVWLPDKSYLICSVYDTIQVWDMINYERVNVLKGQILDTEREQSTCFYACGPALVTGTTKGKIKAFDLKTGTSLGEFSNHSTNTATSSANGGEMICDIKGYKQSLLCTDWRGLLYQWNWSEVGGKFKLVLKRTFYPPLPENDEAVCEKYKSRFCERLVDYNDEVGVTNCADHFCVFGIEKLEVATWVRTERSVLCCQVFDKSAYWAGPEGIVYHQPQSFDDASEDNHKAMIKVIDAKQVSEFYQTHYQDSITSIAVSQDRIMMGDVNAEIHCLSRHITPLSQKSFQFMLESGHSYGSFIWAVQMDASRIFSGDSNACLVIHDFWDRTNQAEESPNRAGSESPPKCKRLKCDLPGRLSE